MENTIVTTLNLEKVCRTCLNESEDMHSIFSEFVQEDSLEPETTILYEILMNISSIRILADDNLPTLICTKCMELTHTSYRFQQQCNRSQAILEAYVSQIQNDTEQLDMIQIDEIDIQNTERSFPEIFDTNSLGDTNDNGLNADFKDNENLFLVEENVEEDITSVKSEKLDVELDAVKVASSEENTKLKERLALKRMKSNSSSTSNRSHNGKKRVSQLNFSYYAKETITGEKVYACNICDRTYKYACSLKIHMRTHTLEKPYVCTICGKDFKQYGSLIYHHRSHTGEQPYSCKICGKRYRQSGTLTAHMRVHTGQRPFLCSVCGRGFRQAPDLGYHMRTHTKERPYMCNICGKTMSMQCHLVQHMRTHTGERPFKCSECDKAFPSSTRLKRHAIIHTGLKPYRCEVCEKSFNRSSSLRVHAKIHTDERPHVCNICQKGFIQAHALRGHMLTHSSDRCAANGQT